MKLGYRAEKDQLVEDLEKKVEAREFCLEVDKHTWAIQWMKNGGTFEFRDGSFDYGRWTAKSLAVRFVTWPQMGEYEELYLSYNPWNLFKASLYLWMSWSKWRVLRRLAGKFTPKWDSKMHYAKAVLPDIPLPHDMTKNMFAVWVNSK